MKTANLKMNQLSAAAYEKYLAYLNAIDDKNITAYGKFLSDDVSVQFNNDAPMVGKDLVLKSLGSYWQSFKTLEHDLTNIYGTDKNYVLEALNHYERHDGRKVTIRAVAFSDLNAKGEIEKVRIYQDVSPLFA